MTDLSGLAADRSRPASGRGRRTRKAALYLIALIVIAATVTAFVQSYDGLYQWANRYLDEGWARTWPLQVDAWIAVGELALYVAYRDRWPARRKVWPWLAAMTGLVSSTVFNVGHLSGVDLAGHLTAAVPPVAAFAGLALGLQVLKLVEENDEARDQASENSDAPDLRPAYNGRRDLVAEAKAILDTNPAITGRQLGHQLRVSERTGRRLLRRLSAPASGDAHQTSYQGA